MYGAGRVYLDVVSPYLYLAFGRAREICEERGAELVLRTMLLGGVHKAVGLQSPVEIKNKGRYQRRDIGRWTRRYGPPMRFPDPFPFRTLKTMRAAMFCEERGNLEPFVREVFALYWEEGGAPKGSDEAGENSPIREVARRIGAVERGVFGAPTFFVGEEMFWGNDRLCFVEEALEKNGRF